MLVANLFIVTYVNINWINLFLKFGQSLVEQNLITSFEHVCVLETYFRASLILMR